jgi:tripartite-type tricarboxylate transporter receptor subunit TctC
VNHRVIPDFIYFDFLLPCRRRRNIGLVKIELCLLTVRGNSLLGVSGPRRSALFPNVLTIAESGLPGYQTVAWGGVIGPANLPAAIVEKLHRENVASLQSPAVRQRFAELGTEPDGGLPQQFQELVKRERPRWAAVIKKAGAKID